MSGSHLTVEQVAQRMGVGRKKVAAWIASGELVAVNTTLQSRAAKPRWRIPVVNVEQFEFRRQSQPVITPRRRRRLATKRYF